MKTVVRAVLLDLCEQKVLLVRHAPHTKWALPGGHLEPQEDLYSALKRELYEEFACEIDIINPPGIYSPSIPTKTDVAMQVLPLPLCMYSIAYNSTKYGFETKQETIFVARVKELPKEADVNEIYQWGWFGEEQIKELSAKQEIYEQVEALVLSVL